MKGLAPHTQRIFEAVAALECIRPYVLVGGTALSLQIDTPCIPSDGARYRSIH